MIRWSLLAAAALVAFQAVAQLPAVPRAADPGAIQQRQIDEERRRRDAERERERARPEEPVKRDALEPPASRPAPDEVRFLVREIRFTPSAILDAAELEAVAAQYRGRQIAFSDLQQLAERVNALYKAKGVVTALAVIPPQDVSDGVVHVQLVEGRVGKVGIEGNASTESSYIARRLRLEPGELVDLDRLEHALVRFNRTNDVLLRAELKPGGQFATTDLQITAVEPPRHDLRLRIDDLGTPSTGTWRTGVAYQSRSVFGYRDDLSLSMTRAGGQDSRAYSYGFPVNTWGGRLNLAYFEDETEIVHGALQSLHITGESRARMLWLRQPTYVGERLQLDVLLGAKKRYSSNWIDGFFLQRTDSSDNNIGADLQLSDGAGLWTANATHYTGHATALDSKRYGIDRGSLGYNRELGSGLSFRGNLAWQSSGDRNLPSSELFFIGGEGSVRGYDVGVYSGDRGYAASLELHHPLGKIVAEDAELSASGFFFVDNGAVKPFRPPNSTQPAELNLRSGGWGLHAQLGKQVYARVVFGYGLTDVPFAPRQYQVHFQLVASAF